MGISLKADVENNLANCGNVRVWLPEQLITQSDAKEFASNDAYEKSVRGLAQGEMLLKDLLHKANFIQNFVALKDRLELAPGQSVLEMGACHGWAAAMVKKWQPDAHVVAADLLADALVHSQTWEQLLDCRLDEKWACHCRSLPFADAQFDRIFTFASFHHFGINNDFSAALREMLRVLRPQGKILLLYEPSAPPTLYRRAFRRVNRKRADEEVDEDLIVPQRLLSQLKELGARGEIEHFPESRYRDSPTSTIYYWLLSKMRWCARYSVCTINVRIERR